MKKNNTKPRYITADEARAITKTKNDTPYTDAFVARMFDDIRKQAKISKEVLFVDLVEYAFHFNIGLGHSGYIYVMEAMEVEAESKGYTTRRICQSGEYLLRVSWAES